jgi:hypothetical protein
MDNLTPLYFEIVDAGVCFYGTPDLAKVEPNLPNVSAPVLAHFGELDEGMGYSDPDTAHKMEKMFQNHQK